MGSCLSKSAVDPSDKNVGAAAATAVAAEGFTYRMGTCALEYWEPIQELGEGSISSIYLVRRRSERIDIPYREKGEIMETAPAKSPEIRAGETVYALKSIVKEYIRNDVFLKEMRREIYTMSHLNHPNIVRVLEAYERNRHIYLIMEYCSGNDLCDREFSEAQAAATIKKILSAVAYMHDHNVVHRDIKLENVMFDKPGQHGDVKVIDFGLATTYLSDEHKRMTDRVGTLYSMAPQVLQGVYDAKCDIWSVGVVSYILLSGKKPFWGPVRDMPWEERKKIMVDRIMRCEYMRTEHGKWNGISKDAKDFVTSLLQMNPRRRPCAKTALQHQWILKYGGMKEIGAQQQQEKPTESEDDSSSDDDLKETTNESDTILATPQNTVIPGGKNDGSVRTCFVFDENTNSVRRSER